MTDSAFAEVFALIGTQLAALSNLRFDASVYSARYPGAGGFDQNSFRLGSAYVRRFSNAWSVEVSPYLTHTTLDGDSFSQWVGAYPLTVELLQKAFGGRRRWASIYRF
jgi:hypothetical protein